VNFDDRHGSFSDIPSEGGTMTMPRKEFFPHVGGPVDGTTMPVEVDDDGVPVETNTIHDITAPNMFFNPTTTSQVNRLTSLYERSERFGDNGFEYVFTYVVQTVENLTDRNAA
jgi:hypothetical protein